MKMSIVHILILWLSFFHVLYAHPLKICRFNKIYQVGDSISDTGNLIREVPVGASTPYRSLPYGQNFFKNATGRCSNGFLMIDYFAMAAGLPLLPPYKDANADFRHGVNFAVAGSTALSSEVLVREHDIYSQVTSSSLGVQLGWLSSHLDSICSDHRGIHKLIKQEKPHAIIVYADYYNAYQFLLGFSKLHGFDTERACCGTGGRYNFNQTSMCGAPDVPVCIDPYRYMSWDGIHWLQDYGNVADAQAPAQASLHFPNKRPI